MIANILDGIVLGLQFGLLAAGLTLVYGMGGVLNLAYGQMAVTSAIAASLAMDAGVPALPAVGLGLLTGGLLGLILDLTILRPVYRRRGEPRDRQRIQNKNKNERNEEEQECPNRSDRCGS